MKKFFVLFLLLFSFPCGAQNLIDAKKVEHIGVFDDWNAYIFNDKKDKVCFVSSMPLKSSGEYTRRGDVFLIVSHRPNEQLYDVLTFVAGYTYLPRSEVQFRAGNLKAALFTSEDTAWAKNLKTDAEIAKAMNKAVRVTVKGLTIESIETYDIFSMKGFNNAMEAINRLCRQSPGPNE
ncbi:MAG: invasion associated locus B family protein [Alphaproteobacteria bacterium]